MEKESQQTEEITPHWLFSVKPFGLYCLGIGLIVVLLACTSNDASNIETSDAPIVEKSSAGNSEQISILNKSCTTINSRFNAPPGFKKVVPAHNSFAEHLINLPLKPADSEVLMYNGDTKSNFNVYEAVVDLPIGTKNLHQCADAVMRLKADYHWKQKQYDQIHFNFTNGFRVDYFKWMQGNRIKVNGNKTSWISRGQPSNAYKDYWKYMETIFMYAGTLSLSKELRAVPLSELSIGDVFIQGGSPGHAVIVVHVAINPATNEKAFMLAQSYMPAQEIQILMNPDYVSLSPWYIVDESNEELRTPEWTFASSDLKRF